MIKLSNDSSDFLFRALFSLIFLGLGAEHIFSDQLIQQLMPQWVPAARATSILCGAWLLFWGFHILFGFHVHRAAVALGIFLIVVTFTVHLPGILSIPASIPAEHTWMWVVLQRSNLVKNICLLGVCFHLINHEVGRYSVDAARSNRASAD